MLAPELVRGTSSGVTLLGDEHRPGGVTLAFTERTGGVSEGVFSSLNLGDACGDSLDHVMENRRRALGAMGLGDLLDELVCPLQVHGDRVVTVGGSGLRPDEARASVREGADAIVCVQPNVPALVCCADCVPVILVAEGGFAVVHSGWRGTIARIAAKALGVLLRETGCDASSAWAYIGPHIRANDYEVSSELANRFVEEFGPDVVVGKKNLSLDEAIRLALVDGGVSRSSIVSVEESTAQHTDRFFSYRAENGACGRHAAIACLGA